jgi:hypothetical protein
VNKVYLVGAIVGKSYGEATDWREYATDRFLDVGIEALSPMRGKSFLKRYDVLDAEHYTHPLAAPAGIMSRDFFDCQRADVILCNFLNLDRPPVGSLMEIAWAYAAHKPIVVAAPKDLPLLQHPMVKVAVSFPVETLDEAIDFVSIILNRKR